MDALGYKFELGFYKLGDSVIKIGVHNMWISDGHVSDVFLEVLEQWQKHLTLAYS